MRDLLTAVRERDLMRSLEVLTTLRDALDGLEEKLVRAARIQGTTWAELGDVLQRSRQAVWKYYSGRGLK